MMGDHTISPSTVSLEPEVKDEQARCGSMTFLKTLLSGCARHVASRVMPKVVFTFRCPFPSVDVFEPVIVSIDISKLLLGLCI